MTTTSIMMDGSALETYRRVAGATQAEMAKAMGLPTRTYEDLAGSKSTVRPVHLVAAERALIGLAHQKRDPSFLPRYLRNEIIELANMIDRHPFEAKVEVRTVRLDPAEIKNATTIHERSVKNPRTRRRDSTKRSFE